MKPDIQKCKKIKGVQKSSHLLVYDATLSEIIKVIKTQKQEYGTLTGQINVPFFYLQKKRKKKTKAEDKRARFYFFFLQEF